MKKLLITGFEPFGDQNINPSWEAVLRLPDHIGEYALIKERLPVVFEKGACAAVEKAKKEQADSVILVGQAGGRDAITPEMVAINLRHATIADNEGNAPKDERIDASAPDAHFSTLPVRKMAQKISDSGIPARVSYSAGAYVCNDCMFTVLNHFKNTPVRVCFIHVPFMTGQKEGAFEMPLQDMTRALEIAVSAIDE